MVISTMSAGCTSACANIHKANVLSTVKRTLSRQVLEAKIVDMISICCFGGSFERLHFNMVVPSTRCYTITSSSSSALWKSLDDLNSLQCHAFIELWKVTGLQFAGIKPDVLVLLVGSQRIPKSVTTVGSANRTKLPSYTVLHFVTFLGGASGHAEGYTCHTLRCSQSMHLI